MKLSANSPVRRLKRMRFTVRFRKYEGEFRTIIAHLSAREVESVEALRKSKGTQTADDAAAAYALRAAYREVPAGFDHIAPPALVAA